MRDDKVSLLEEQVRTLKQEFWGDRQIILHSRDIRKCQNGFEILFDLDVKHRFSFVLERAIFCVDNQCEDGNGKISAIVERRGKREDRNLQSYYEQLLEKGTYWVTADAKTETFRATTNSY